MSGPAQCSLHIACRTDWSEGPILSHLIAFMHVQGGGPRVVVNTAAFHARVRGSAPDLGGLKETKMFLPHPRVKDNIVGSLRDREVACSAPDRQGSNFESCVWRTVSSQSSHHPQEVLLAQFSLYVHKGGLKPDSFHLCMFTPWKQQQTQVFKYPKYRFLTRDTFNCLRSDHWNTIGGIKDSLLPDYLFHHFRLICFIRDTFRTAH